MAGDDTAMNDIASWLLLAIAYGTTLMLTHWVMFAQVIPLPLTPDLYISRFVPIFLYATSMTILVLVIIIK